MINVNNLKTKVASKDKKFFTMVGGVLLAVFVIVSSIFAYGIYAQGWADSTTKAYSKFVPYPAAGVNGRWIRYSSFLEEVDSLKRYYTAVQKVDYNKEEGKKRLQENRTQVMDQLVQGVLIQQQAKKYKVSVSGKDVDSEYNKIIEANGGKDKINKIINDYYGWDTAKFKEKIRSDLLKQRLQEKVSKDEVITAASKKEAENVLAKVKAGEDFAELAKKFSQDTTASNGGDLGMFARGTMVKEFEDVAFTLKAGETSGLVKSQFGYHIIKVDEKTDDKIRARHILIKTKDYNSWLDDLQKEAKVKKYIKV